MADLKNPEEATEYMEKEMRDRDYRALLDLYMCSDPWPVPLRNGETDEMNHETVTALLDGEAKARGFESWVDAYHSADLPRLTAR